jgi:hypothetical protein
MKGACQEKTSPKSLIKSYFFDRQHSTYPQATLAGSVARIIIEHEKLQVTFPQAAIRKK